MRCFLHTGRYFRTSTEGRRGGRGEREEGGGPDGRRVALSEISRCRPHKSTVDTAVGRAYALTRSTRWFGRNPLRLASPRLVSSLFSALPLSLPLVSARIHILKVIYCRITLTAQPGPKRIKETSLLSFFRPRGKMMPSRALVAPPGAERGEGRRGLEEACAALYARTRV